MGRYVPECDDFYLHFGSSDSRLGTPSEFTVGVAPPRGLPGAWKMALKEISYTKWNKERSFKDQMEFVLVAPEEHTARFNAFYNDMKDRKVIKPILEYGRNAIPGLPNAVVVAYYARSGDPSHGVIADPEGQFSNAEDYIRAVNDILTEMWQEGHFHAAPFFYQVDKNEPLKTVYSSWNYPREYRRQIGVFPIIGYRNRRLLGIPQDYDEVRMIRTLQKTFAQAPTGYYDIELQQHGFTQKDDNMIVLCDLVSTTGVREDLNGCILRIIPNKQEEEGKKIFYDFSEDYYEVTPKSHFFSLTVKLVSNRDYRPLNLQHPTTFTLHFKPVNQCVPLVKKPKE